MKKSITLNYSVLIRAITEKNNILLDKQQVSEINIPIKS